MRSDYRDRLIRAIDNLEQLRDATRHNHSEYLRLQGKAQGVKLALSYIEEEERS